MIILLIILAVLTIAAVLTILHFRKTNKILKTIFRNSSTYTFGAKGKGKDLLFQKVINLRKNEGYYSNIYYGGYYQNLNLNAMNVEPNTINDFINGELRGIRTYLVEQRDLYVSDAGLYLPNYEDAKLNKEYKSMPLFIAVQRHILLSNTHVNSQAYGRVWKKIREQADFYFKALKVVKIMPFALYAKIRIYDKETSAEQDLRPLKRKLFQKNSQSQADYSASNGLIEERWYRLSRRKIKYDTRAFKRLFKIFD